MQPKQFLQSKIFHKERLMLMLDILSQKDKEYGANLIILVGPPGSGKSTYARTLVKKDSVSNWIIISPDTIRGEITGNEADQSQNIQVFRRVYTDLINALDKGHNVIYDATNCRSAYRHKILNIVKGHTNKIICVMCVTAMSDCLKNNKNRDRVVPEDVIERMYFTLKKHPPTIFEGYDAIIKL